MKNVCLVDLDDTLGDFKTPCMNALNRVTNQNIHWDKWSTYNFPEVYGLNQEEFLDILMNEHVIENVEIHDSSYKFLNDLNDLDYHTVLITARGWHPDGKGITERWVSDHDLDIDDLIVVEGHQSKIEVISKFNNIVFAVDDRIKHCREYTQTGKIEHVLVYDQPWNTHLTRWNHEWGGHDYDDRIIDLHEIISQIEWCVTNGRISNVC